MSDLHKPMPPTSMANRDANAIVTVLSNRYSTYITASMQSGEHMVLPCRATGFASMLQRIPARRLLIAEELQLGLVQLPINISWGCSHASVCICIPLERGLRLLAEHTSDEYLSALSIIKLSSGDPRPMQTLNLNE